MECICFETSLPFFKDLTRGALYRSGRNSAEYLFWLEFFKDSPSLLNEFQKRVEEAPRGFIAWDFIRPGDKNLSAKSMAEQYREALNFVRDCLQGTSSHLIKNLENLTILEKGANDVISNREAALEAHKNDGNTRAQEVHREIHSKWLEVRNAISEALKKIKP